MLSCYSVLRPSRWCRWLFVRHRRQFRSAGSTPLSTTAPGDRAASCRALPPIDLRCRHLWLSGSFLDSARHCSALHIRPVPRSCWSRCTASLSQLPLSRLGAWTRFDVLSGGRRVLQRRRVAWHWPFRMGLFPSLHSLTEWVWAILKTAAIRDYSV